VRQPIPGDFFGTLPITGCKRPAGTHAVESGRSARLEALDDVNRGETRLRRGNGSIAF